MIANAVIFVAQWLLPRVLEDSLAVQKAFDAYRVDKMDHAPVTLLRSPKDGQWIRYEGFASAEQLVGETRRHLEH